MIKITKDFAIKYLLDDCDNCPEIKDGRCMTKSHCFEIKEMVINALKQESQTEDDILKAIKDNCNNYSECKGCKYLNNDTLRCKFRDIPLTWELE